jgi:hypothetical protein
VCVPPARVFHPRSPRCRRAAHGLLSRYRHRQAVWATIQRMQGKPLEGDAGGAGLGGLGGGIARNPGGGLDAAGARDGPGGSGISARSERGKSALVRDDGARTSGDDRSSPGLFDWGVRFALPLPCSAAPWHLRVAHARAVQQLVRGRLREVAQGVRPLSPTARGLAARAVLRSCGRMGCGFCGERHALVVRARRIHT